MISGLTGTDGSGTEYYTAWNLIVSGSQPGGPVRVGIFAREGSSRQEAGASYWGIMELSGNLWERAISVATGRAFTGLHGNGTLTAAGGADIANWPTTGSGAGLRGGYWEHTADTLRASDRINAARASIARNRVGWRGVRSAP